MPRRKKKSSLTPLRKQALLKRLKEFGLTCTYPNFIIRYETMICQLPFCPHRGKPYLESRRNDKGDRIYTAEEIEEICWAAKHGWSSNPKHFHWFPGIQTKS